MEIHSYDPYTMQLNGDPLNDPLMIVSVPMHLHETLR